jgi:hypothetical protein
MTHHSEKENPASKPQTKRMLNAGLDRAGDPAYPDHAPSSKLRQQSAGAKRQGDNAYLGYPDVSKSDGPASTDHTGAGSKKGSR